MTLGNIIRKYREQNNISMDEFAYQCGLSKGYISMLENNVNPRSKKPIAPTLPSLSKIADGMGMDLDELLKLIDSDQLVSLPKPEHKGISINVYGRVAAGIPIEMIEDIIDTEEIPEEMAKGGEYFGLQIHGDSMEPKISDGDIVIIRKQDDAETGDTVIVAVNGTDATCKRIKKFHDGIELISNNPSYEPMFYSNDEIRQKPVTILGKVVELRSKL